MVDEIAMRLRDDILNGDLHPGQRLSVAGIAREYGVSHIPVREAVRRLEAECLVDTVPHKGSVVAGVSQGELSEIYGLRRLIEADIAARAVERYTAADVERISAAHKRLRASDPADPEGEFWEAHRDFHWAMLAPALDGWSDRVLGLLWQSAERYRRLAGLAFGSLKRANSEHRALTKAAAEKEPDRVKALLLEHLTNTEQVITQGFLAAAEHREPDAASDG